MAKRIKKVFSTPDQVLHLWANQSQSDARSANVFFDGTTCYSYGRHYTLGILVKVKGHTVAVINDRGYSVTTAKHIGIAWDASSHLPRIKSSTLDWKQGLKDTSAKLNDDLQGLLRQRSFWSSYSKPDAIDNYIGKGSYLGESIGEFNKTCKLLGQSKLCIKVTASYKKQLRTHIDARLARTKELKSPEYQAIKQAKEAKKNAKAIQDWRNGGQLTKAVRAVRPMLIRVNNDQVETSGGAVVPLNEAITLLRDIESGRSVINNEIGGFKVDTVNHLNSGLIQIGCHTFSIKEAFDVLGQFRPKLELVVG